ncbi:P1 family peptidase [Streptomyces sampsonii]|uniref:P1 family peptidase n=1 Tax=Streptomyces sampsonii TaxID=42239 RepID=UPI00082F4991|nr:P1 family peptidase [Streptomyces sampsonii]
MTHLPEPPPPGRQDALTDVPGLQVGHATRQGDGWLTGTTVVLTGPGGAVAAVDVRGGGPGTRETDALDPRNLVERVEAVVLTGGSAFGLDAASGVTAWLEEQGRGVRVGPGPHQVVPVVPAACLFDLGRGGDWRARPGAGLGREAVERAAAAGPVGQGVVGAGTGAVAGGLKGGVGTASLRLASGHTVAALVVVNAVGSVCDPATGVLYGRYFTQLPGAGGRAVWPSPETHERAQARWAAAMAETERRGAPTVRPGAAEPPSPGAPAPGAPPAGQPPLNTTIAVVATDAALTRAQAQKLAGTSHDGLARAVRPVHLLHDGDTVFTLATGDRPVEGAAVNEILAAGADAMTRAIVKAVLSAESVETPAGVFPSYRELYGDLTPES